MEIERALTYLPKLSNQKILEKISPFYSILGDVSDEIMQDLNIRINHFAL
jgi:hypothetical protein